MPTCKEDCLHYDICSIVDDLGECRYDAKHCKHFKDRSKFIELHCKIGQKVYAYCEQLHEILEYTIYCVNVFRENSITYQADCYDEENGEALSEIGFETNDIGELIFLTRKEAEQALKEREE